MFHILPEKIAVCLLNQSINFHYLLHGENSYDTDEDKFSPCHVEFIGGKIKMHLHFLQFFTPGMAYVMEDNDQYILHGQYHGCWWSVAPLTNMV